MTTATAVTVGAKVQATWGNAVKDDLDDLYTVVSDSSIGTAGAGWTTNAGTVARTALGGKLVFVHLYLQRTGALTATSGNVADETVFTLDSAYRPTETINCPVGTGTEGGEATINSAGTVQIRALSDSASAGANYRFTFSFLTA